MSGALRKRALSLLHLAALCLLFSLGMRLWSQTDVVRPAAQTAATLESSNEAPKIPIFDAISVRKAKNPQAYTWHLLGDGYSAEGISVTQLISWAYAIPLNSHIVGLPDWTSDPRYDVEAKVGETDVAALQKEDWKQRYAMLHQILAERFKLKAHREAINQTIYSLIVTKKGLLHETPPTYDSNNNQLGARITRRRRGQLTATGLTMHDLASDLSPPNSDREVVDRTGLAGQYDIKLDWNPDDGNASTPDSSAPSIFTAVQEQLGLKLVPTTGPVDCLIIDHIEPPSEN